MKTKPTLYDTARYFQQQADHTRNPDRKAHYQRWADHYLAEAKKIDQAEKARNPETKDASAKHER